MAQTKLASAPLREVLEGVVDRLATAHGNEVLRILRNPESEALAGVVPLCGRLMLNQAVPGLGEVTRHADPALRLAAVQALAQLAAPEPIIGRTISGAVVVPAPWTTWRGRSRSRALPGVRISRPPAGTSG